ncbi:hypothetical protein DL771_004518 [Monosporascus sp. 5C6A]|nr:hypothetical protein DL771_004518 [Monosporascus sp. 5C6A]
MAMDSNASDDKGGAGTEDRICSLVNTIGHSPGSAQPHFVLQSAPSPSSCGVSTSPRAHAVDASELELESDFFLTAHAAFATEFVEKAVKKSSTMHVPPEVTTSLRALREIIDINPSSRHSSDVQGPQPEGVPAGETIGGVQMPPLQSAITCLGMLRAQVRYMWCGEIDSIGQFMEYFLTVYSGKPSNADLIIVNAGLSRLFTECSSVETEPSSKADYKSQASVCRQNLELILTRLPFILPFTIDYALALYMAVYDDIYSPSALSQPEEVRIARARGLAAELQIMFESTTPLEVRAYQSGRVHAAADHSAERAEKVSYLAVLTLIYRSIPPSPYSGSAFGEECIATAIRALEEHENCISSLYGQSTSLVTLYVQWKQCSIFTMMYEVACKYVEAKATVAAGTGDAHTVSAEFDELFRDAEMGAQLRSPILRFSEIGNRQMFGSDLVGADGGDTAEREAANGADLGNWFDQNQQIFRLMDDADG